MRLPSRIIGPETRPKPRVAGKKIRIALLTPFSQYEVFRPLQKGAMDAGDALHVEVVFGGTMDGDLFALSKMIDQTVSEGADAIGLNLVDGEALGQAAVAALAKGIPLIAFNVDDPKTPEIRLAKVGQDMVGAGRILGHEIARLVPKRSHALITLHDHGIAALSDRSKGLRSALQHRHLRFSELITSTDRAVAATRIEDFLRLNSDANLILSTGLADTEAAGLVRERATIGRDVMVAGFDLSVEILRLIKGGHIRFTIDQHTYAQGYYAIVALALSAKYGIAPANIDTGAAIVRADDVDILLKLLEEGYR